MIWNVCGPEELFPPSAVPPLSWRVTVSWAVPAALGAVVNERAPAGVIAGVTLKRAALSVVTLKASVCADSFGGPAEIPVAQPGNNCGPASSRTVMFGPLANE